MSSMPPASSDLPPRSPRHDWLPSRRGLLLTALAFLAGLVLFAMVWRSQSRNDFYRVEPVARPAASSEFDPLPTPLPGQTPPPDYPRRALRRGIEGTVLVRVDVGPDGVPTSVGISQSSRSRELDRAAIEAVERWRFRPAMADGRPTVGTVVVPIDFNARR